MTDKRITDGPELDEWETQVNALLDGELDPDATAQLKAAAAEDHALARAIIEAYELQRSMDQVGIERAPDSLNKRLLAIPAEQTPSRGLADWLQPRWLGAGALAAVTLAVASALVLQPREPSAAEVEQARKELGVAFAYLDRTGLRAGEEIHDVLGTNMSGRVSGMISRHLPYTEQSSKEKNS